MVVCLQYNPHSSMVDSHGQG
uniref:Uncharacterized protein n=1 Tax=Anguilla anguilla TaxID=7936 RepID=A0A0E9VC31_ANGAN